MMTPRATSDPTVTFVCCIESGSLEPMTVRLLESLRRNGGALADSPALAIAARVGPPLTAQTRRRLGELGVAFRRVGWVRRYGWYHFMNKPVAMAAAEEFAKTDVMAFLDSDILIAGEPSSLLPRDGEDYTACAPDTGIVGTTGPGCEHEPVWSRLCAALSMQLDALPWVRTEVEKLDVRLYWNSAVWAYRRSTRLGAAYLEVAQRLLDSKICFPRYGEHWLEQVSLGLAAEMLQLRWRALPLSHNYTMGSFRPTHEDIGGISLSAARILHYHDSMKPAHWPAFVQRVTAAHPQKFEWLGPLGPLGNPAGPASRAASAALRVCRGLPRRWYRRHGPARDVPSTTSRRSKAQLLASATCGTG